MKNIPIIVFVLCLALAGCKKECGYITVEIGDETRAFSYNDSVVTGSPFTVHRFEYTADELYYFPDWPVNLNDDRTVKVKDCQTVKL